MTEVNFVGYECRVLVDDYKKMMLVDKFTGQPVAVATKVVPGVSLENDEVIIKSYSENEGAVRGIGNSRYRRANRQKSCIGICRVRHL